MLIQHVALTNFKSYRDAEVDLAPGTVAIVGPNGAGKSSLLEAIGLTLFDCQRGTYAERLRQGAGKGSVVVRVTSSLDERTYNVCREFTHRSTTSYVVTDVELGDRLLANGSEEVTAWLRQHLHVDESPGLSALFETTIGVAQGTFTAPFLQPASARKALFDPLLRVDTYRAAYEALRPTQRYLQGHQHELERLIAHMEGQLQDLPQWEAQLEAVRARQNELASAIEKLERTINQLEPRIGELEACQDRARQAEEVRHQARLALDHQQHRVADAKEQLRRAELAQEVMARSEPGHRAYLAADARLSELEQQREARDTLTRRQATLRTKQARLQERSVAATANLDRARAARARAEALRPHVERQEQLEEQLRDAEGALRDASALDKRIRKLEDGLARETEERDKLRAQATQAQAVDEKRAHLEEQIAGLDQQSAMLAGEMAQRRADLAQIRSQTKALGQASATCPVCEQPLPSDHRQSLLGRNAARLEQLQAAVDQAAQRALGLSHQKEQLQESLRQVQAALRTAPSAGELSRAQRRVTQVAEELEQARRDRQTMADPADRAKELRSALAEMGDPRAVQRAALQAAQDIAAISSELSSLREALAKLEEEAAGVESALSSHGNLDRAIRQAHQERDQHRSDHEALLSSRDAARELPERRRQLQAAETELDGLATSHSQAVHAAEEARAAYDAEEHRRVQDEIRDARDGLAAARARQEALSEQRCSLQQRVRELATLRDEVDTHQQALLESHATSQLLSFLRDLLRDAGPLVTQRLIRRISHQAAIIYGELMGQADGRLVWQDDYGLSLEIGEEQRGYEQLSGGERMAAALAVRMALLRETSAVDVAFFDEPTAHLDSQRRESLAERIMGVRGFSQLFVISHDDTFERAAQSYVRIWRDARGSHAET
jgi:DNA repair protein SbcC/Rad50